MALRRASRSVVLALVAAALVLALAAAPAAALTAPVAAGTSAANIPLNGSSKRVVLRWVARASGTLSALHLRIQADGSVCRLNGRTGYGLGDGGSWIATTHPVLPDGRPDTSSTLARQEFRPCSAGLDTVDVLQGVVKVKLGLPVVKGAEYATVIRNGDATAGVNYTSVNFLYTSTGLVGANGRNERSAMATDAYYGLDPRELVGYSTDGGDSWSLPGGPYGLPGGRNFLPTYIQEFADGQMTGQPYYYTAAGTTSDKAMVFGNITRQWVIRELGAFTLKPDSGTLTLTVDGVQKARVTVRGPGMVRAAIPVVTVQPGQTVRVASSGLSISNIVADTAWGRLMGLQLTSTPWKLDGESNFSHAAPVYALPAPDALGATGRRWVHHDTKSKARKGKGSTKRAAGKRGGKRHSARHR